MHFSVLTLKRCVAAFLLLSILLEENKHMMGIEPLKWKLYLAGNDVHYLWKETATGATPSYLPRLWIWQVSCTKQGISDLYFNGRSPRKS